MKTIFITGASRGIGLELTRQLLVNGNRLIASCRNPEKADNLRALQSEFKALEIVGLAVDDENSVLSCFNKLKDDNQKIDLLFNNAGIIDWDDMNAVTPDSLEKVYRTNLIGALLVLRASIPCLRKSTQPLVVNLSSRLGSISLRGNTQLGGAIAYQCSKAALNMLTKQASIDLSVLGIRVISLSPGWVRTEMGGNEAKYEVSESVRLMLESLDNLNPGDSGIFLGEDGSEISW
jgi:NAD(P)-dependent dehydrogenase (short-subunit alcohol dehydrogenase family)